MGLSIFMPYMPMEIGHIKVFLIKSKLLQRSQTPSSDLFSLPHINRVKTSLKGVGRPNSFPHFQICPFKAVISVRRPFSRS